MPQILTLYYVLDTPAGLTFNKTGNVRLRIT